MGFAVTTTCREPERFIQFVDYLCSDEGQILLNWGIEGQQYQVENGVRTVIGSVWQKFYMDPTYRQQVGMDAYSEIWPSYRGSSADESGNFVLSPYQGAHYRKVIPGWKRKCWSITALIAGKTYIGLTAANIR